MNRTSLRRDPIVAMLAMVSLIVWSWNRLDFFDISRAVIRADGSSVVWPNALAAVDHPFHAARFGLFLDAIRDGRIPHWVFAHQGGYPAEFYPFGSLLVDLIVWAATLGQLSIPMVHTWSVAIVFALPAVGFWGIARLAGLPVWIAPVGLAIHLCVRGWWWSGGSYELIEWGLVTNVLAAVLVFLALIAVAAAISGSGHRWSVMAAFLIAWAEFTNPRSLLAVATVAVAALLVLATERDRVAVNWRWLLAPFALGMGLSAPILLPLVVDNDLYYFVHYSGYNSLGTWLESSIQTVSGPVFVLAIVGMVIAVGTAVSVVERLIAYTTIIYALGTIWIVVIDWPRRFTGQLETTRLMPFQRLLMIALAVIAVGRAIAWLAPRWQLAVGIAATVLIPILYVIAPPGFIPESDRGLLRTGTMAQPGLVDLRAAVERADADAQAGSAILILGTTAYWHDHLWATLWSDRLFFYDDWLWYWQREHFGAYDPVVEHAYPSDSSTIDPAYLSTHGIGAVVVTGQARDAASAASFLEQVRSGIYDVYLVPATTAFATLGDRNVPSAIDAESVTVTGIDAGGVVTIRENWFPRWQATVDGERAKIVHRPDGYMDITVPPGSAELRISYERAGFEWFALLIAAVAAAVCLFVLVRFRPTGRSELRSASADFGPAPR